MPKWLTRSLPSPPSSLTATPARSQSSTFPEPASCLLNFHHFQSCQSLYIAQSLAWQISLSSKKDFPLMGPDLVWLLYLKTFSAARHTLPESLLDPHPHTQPLHTPTFHFTCLLTIISHFFPPSSVNFLLLSPYKSPPLLFVEACLIAISVTPYYISNDWLWALIRDVLGRADLPPPPPSAFPQSCYCDSIAVATPLAQHL